MAVLPNNEREEVSLNWQRANHLPLDAITKADLRAAVNAMDDWAEGNAATLNLAIPLPARTALTAKQKAWLFYFVVRRRFEVL